MENDEILDDEDRAWFEGFSKQFIHSLVAIDEIPSNGTDTILLVLDRINPAAEFTPDEVDGQCGQNRKRNQRQYEEFMSNSLETDTYKMYVSKDNLSSGLIRYREDIPVAYWKHSQNNG